MLLFSGDPATRTRERYWTRFPYRIRKMRAAERPWPVRFHPPWPRHKAVRFILAADTPRSSAPWRCHRYKSSTAQQSAAFEQMKLSAA